jgi:sulfur carrier protein
MRLILNGQSIDTGAAMLIELLRDRGIDPERPGIAVAINGEVVTRTEWNERHLAEGDDVEIITAMQGG